MKERKTFFVDVILPLAVPNLFTYRVPMEMNDDIKEGKRVVVQFGKNKLYTALIRKIHETAPKKYEAKYIENILDAEPIVNSRQFLLWEWMSEYYVCTIGEVMNAALPSGLKLSSETKIILNPEFNIDKSALSDDEFLIQEALQTNETLTMDDVMQIVGKKIVHPLLKSLLEKNIVIIYEELKEKYKPKMTSFVRFTSFADDENNLKEIFGILEKAQKQLDIVMSFVKLSARYSKNKQEVKKSELLKSVNAGDATLNSLVKKNVFEIYERETGRFSSVDADGKIKKLNDEQQSVLDSIKQQFGLNKFGVRSSSNLADPSPNSELKNVVLLHGVTSSGKTEVYVKLIEETIAQGKQALYLLPEIALTTQIISRLQKYFGDKVGVYHSRFNENERVEVWKNVLASHKFEIVLGARSALFLPFSNLGLVIVDEEHDTSFKQYDPAPRYNARDSAIYLSGIHNAKTLLGSATPAIETYYNAQIKKFGFSELKNRFGGVLMPEISIVNIADEAKRKRMKSHFSPQLLDGIQLALDNKEQVILFQNRRGFSPYTECDTCGWTPMCKNCDVSLTYHKTINQLRCHYCGYTAKPPSVCGKCGSANLQMKGFGTEKIEDELQFFFPSAKIARMDLDTTRSKFAYRQIISDFEDMNIDVLVGTQMVTKGLDFDNVALVGVLNADIMLNFPDFRSFERAYQLMAQVSGRAGRKSKQGKVIIQTRNPEHAILKQVIANDYYAMYLSQLNDRKQFNYPPFYRLIEITLKHKDTDLLDNASKHFASELKNIFGKNILGPVSPVVSRIRNEYLKTILIKNDRQSSVKKVKQTISSLLVNFKNNATLKPVKVAIDVDPA